jgi:pimeloyl-ACP methyl ester carboxylesterase
MPLLLFFTFLIDLLSVALLGVDIFLFREWYVFRTTTLAQYAWQCLYAAAAIGVYLLLGRYTFSLLLCRWNFKGEEQPNLRRGQERKYIRRSDGSKIYVEFFGPEDAQPIIFIHGWSSNRKEWFYQRKYFSEKYRVILMDLPGLGRSTRADDRKISLEKMSDDLDEVIKLTSKKPILWGHSIGGMVILANYLRHRSSVPVSVKALILQNTTYTNPILTSFMSKLLLKIQKPILEPLCYLMLILSPLVRPMRWLSYLNGHQHILSRILLFTGRQTWRQLNMVSFLAAITPPSVFARGVLATFRYDASNVLPFIKVPVCIVGGGRDKLTKPEASVTMHNQIPTASLFMAEDAGHCSLIERHAEINEAVGDFINLLD